MRWDKIKEKTIDGKNNNKNWVSSLSFCWKSLTWQHDLPSQSIVMKPRRDKRSSLSCFRVNNFKRTQQNLYIRIRNYLSRWYWNKFHSNILDNYERIKQDLRDFHVKSWETSEKIFSERERQISINKYLSSQDQIRIQWLRKEEGRQMSYKKFSQINRRGE